MDVKKIKTTITPVKDQTTKTLQMDKMLEMQSTIDAYKQSGEAMGKEILALQRSINSYKGENTKLRKRNKELITINDALCKKNIELRRNVGEWKNKYDRLEQDYETLSKKLDKFLALPWYKKIFVK